MAELVYAAHAVRPEEIYSTAVVWTTQTNAEAYAREVSTDPEVLAGAVTRFMLDTPGIRKPIALFVNGERQAVPHLSDDRRIAANGWIVHRRLRGR